MGTRARARSPRNAPRIPNAELEALYCRYLQQGTQHTMQRSSIYPYQIARAPSHTTMGN